MLIRDFDTYRIRCKVCKEVKDRNNYKRMSFGICNDCRESYRKNQSRAVKQAAKAA